MGKKFEMRAILFENGALGIAVNCNDANSAEVITVLREIVYAVAKRQCLDEVQQDRFIHYLINAILTKREEEDRI